MVQDTRGCSICAFMWKRIRLSNKLLKLKHSANLPEEENTDIYIILAHCMELSGVTKFIPLL